MSADLGWYARRLSRMGPAEVAGRARAAVVARRWRDAAGTAAPDDAFLEGRRFTAALDPEVIARVPDGARERLLARADRHMDGRAEFFGVSRTDLLSPDWSWDPKTGRRAPSGTYAFDIDYRDERAVGDVKQLWELSRHQHLTVLAAAFAATGDGRYAGRVRDHLTSWWAANPPLRGAHWTSGIELGIRLLSWVWIRRLLDGWPEAPALFEDNPEALHQVWWHQRWLASFPSVGSSANNHAVAEEAGRLAAACAFPWFRESAGWRVDAAASLERQLARNTFTSGLNRELATEYHGLVLELGLASALEAEAAGHPLAESTWLVLSRMVDALAAVVDGQGRPPRQGDGDDGVALVVDGDDFDRWASLLATGQALFGGLSWWQPVAASDVRTSLLAGLARPRSPVSARPERRPAHFPDAGLTILRASGQDADEEIWCRCDGGPHGFLSIAAHAHADALSVEVRRGGVDILADPGTFCYHGDPQWRRYFRSTLGHNTVELGDRDQSVAGGPFMWIRHARSRVVAADVGDGDVVHWCAQHDGYSRRRRSAPHRRSVELNRARHQLRIVDQVAGARGRRVRLAFHLGPRVTANLVDDAASLCWTADGRVRLATLQLPETLSWTAHRAETSPPAGWYSPGFGRKEPATTLIGSGRVDSVARPLITLLRFAT